MKRTFILTLILLTFFSLTFVTSNAAIATDEIHIIINGSPIELPKDNSILNENGRVLLPLRILLNNLGISDQNISWDNNSKTVYFKNTESSVVIRAESIFAMINENTFKLDTPAKLYNNRLYLPLRFISQSLNMEVEWDSKNKNILVADKDFLKRNRELLTKINEESGSMDFNNFEIVDTSKVILGELNIQWKPTKDIYEGIISTDLNPLNNKYFPFMFTYSEDTEGNIIIISKVLHDPVGNVKKSNLLNAFLLTSQSLLGSGLPGLPLVAKVSSFRQYTIDGYYYTVQSIKDGCSLYDEEGKFIAELSDIGYLGSLSD